MKFDELKNHWIPADHIGTAWVSDAGNIVWKDAAGRWAGTVGGFAMVNEESLRLAAIRVDRIQAELDS